MFKYNSHLLNFAKIGLNSIRAMATAERGHTFPCFKDKVVIITGASSGIGETTALEFAKDGAKLAITGRNAERLSAVAQECVKQGIPESNVVQLLGDISDDKFIEQMVNETVSKLGGIDVVVNNAGTSEMAEPGVYDKAMLDRMLDMFVRSLYPTLTHIRPHLKKSKGSIVNISSLCATAVGPYTMREYDTAKSATNHLTRTLAYELALDGININTVSPGVIGTPLFTAVAGDAAGKILQVASQKSGFKRHGYPIDVARAVQFMASSAASYITGHDLIVDGGMSSYPFLMPHELE